MKILVTGAAGFIGFHVCKALLQQGYEIVGLDNLNNYYDPTLKIARLNHLTDFNEFSFKKADLADYTSMKEIFNENQFDKVCNLAAQAGVRYSLQNPFVYQKSNIEGFLNVLELCRQTSVKSLVYASSSSVYGGNDKIPFAVSDTTDKPISLYAATKKANELIAYTYHHLYGLKCTGLRFFTVYGPWGRPDMALFLFVKSILEGKEIEVYNFGQMKRDFTYIDDIVLGILAALDKEFDNEIFNLGNSKPVELTHFIKCIEDGLGIKARVRYLPLQAGDVLETYADISYSVNKLGFNPKTSIEEGIGMFLNWYKSYYQL